MHATPATFRRIRDLFEQARELDRAEHERFLAREEPDSAEIRVEVMRLLSIEQGGGEFLESPLVAGLAPSWTPSPGDVVGAYRLERSLGAGGTGEVFAARQDRPSRLVAIKVLRTSRLSDETRSRFQVEAEILGHLRHPGIAAIHEMGVHRTPDGEEVPFIAMEHVEGARDLVSFARSEHLDVRARVERMREVCSAVHHAHQKGVIHRDLKPANILVDANGRTKVIDYGVARVTDPGIAHGPHTMTGYVLGTLYYMSPEQIARESADVDTRSDVYALGVILYELLCGRLPHDTKGRPIAQVIAEITGRPPEPPSKHAADVPRDLDRITLKALEIDRERRYGSAAALAEDLGRFLRDEPVEAAPPTRRYRLRKFVARNRALVAAGVFAALSLLGGTVAASLEARRANDQTVIATNAGLEATKQAESARRALKRQVAVTEALTGMLSSVDPGQDGRKVTLFQLLERWRPRLETEFAGEPELRSAIESFLATAYDSLGLHAVGEELLESSIKALETAPEGDASKLAWLRAMLAKNRINQGRMDEAETLIDQSLLVLKREAGLDAQITLRVLRIRATYLLQRGVTAGAAKALAEVIEGSTRLVGPTHRDTLMPMGQLARTLCELRRFAEAREMAQRAYQGAVDTVTENHPLTMYVGMELGQVLQASGHAEEAVPILQMVTEKCVELFGELHRNTAMAPNALSLALAKVGDFEAAELASDRALDLAKRYHPSDFPLEVQIRVVRTELFALKGDRDASAAELEEGIRCLERSNAKGHAAYADLQLRLSRSELAAGKAAESERRIRAQIERFSGDAKREVRRIAVMRGLLGLALEKQGKDAEAREELGACCDVFEKWKAEDLNAFEDHVYGVILDAAAHAGREEMRARLSAARLPEK